VKIGVYCSGVKTVKNLPCPKQAAILNYRNPSFWRKSDLENFDVVIVDPETKNSVAIIAAYEERKVPVGQFTLGGAVQYGEMNLSQDYGKFRQGMWSGSPCLIIGGGPSVKIYEEEVRKFISQFPSIGINRVFETFNCDVAFGTDRRWLQWIVSGQYGKEAQRAWKKFRGIRAILRGSKWPVPGGMEVFDPYRNANEFSPNLHEGLTRSSNSGIPAINLAILLGANPIYLIGFDSKPTENGLQNHFHSGHPETQKDSVFNKFIEAFDKFAKKVPENVEVINLYPASGIKSFAFGKWADIEYPAPKTPPPTQDPPKAPKPPENPVGNFVEAEKIVFVTAFTPDYEPLAVQLQTDFEKWGLPHEMIPLEDLGKWEHNCNLKPWVLKCIREEFPNKIIVWVDADARILKFPEKIVSLKAGEFDIAYHELGSELLSGTLVFSPTEAANSILDQWEEEVTKFPDVWDQKSLQKILKKQSKVVKYNLPVEYCKIFDNKKQKCKTPVIQHMQQSRVRKKREKVS